MATVWIPKENCRKFRNFGALQKFISLVDQLEQDVSELPLHEQADQAIQASGLKAMYQAEKGERAEHT